METGSFMESNLWLWSWSRCFGCVLGSLGHAGHNPLGDHVDILLVDQLGGRHLADGLAGFWISALVPGNQLEQQALRIAT